MEYYYLVSGYLHFNLFNGIIPSLDIDTAVVSFSPRSCLMDMALLVARLGQLLDLFAKAHRAVCLRARHHPCVISKYVF